MQHTLQDHKAAANITVDVKETGEIYICIFEDEQSIGKEKTPKDLNLNGEWKAVGTTSVKAGATYGGAFYKTTVNKGEDLSEGVVMVQNIYEAKFPFPAGTKIQELRIVQIFAKPNLMLNEPNIGKAAQSLARGVLGTVPVEKDGSVNFKMPTEIPVYFQAMKNCNLKCRNKKRSVPCRCTLSLVVQTQPKEDRSMEQSKHTEDSRKGKHLTHDDRITIEAMARGCIPPRVIASIVGKSRRTIERELVRGRVIHKDSEWREKEVYSSDRGQDVYDLNATAKGKNLKLGSNRKMVKFISERILLHRESPDIVAFRMKSTDMTDCVCTKTIYSYIDMGLIDGVSNETLLEKRNRRKHKKHKIRRSPKRLAKGTSIEKRPAHIDNREEFGHWEMDLVVGPRKGGGAALLTLVERKTRCLIVHRIPDKTQESVLHAMKLIEKEYGSINFRKIFKTITVDNGSEFLDADAMEKSAFSNKKRTQIYYAHPYSSWERGSNENTNRIIRRFIAKGHKISKYTKIKIKEFEQWINQYPRRILEFASPHELLTNELSILT